MNQYVFEPVKPVVQTKYGALRGVTYGDVNIFMGVQYAKSKRFQMPEEPDSWEGIKNAYQSGPVSKLMNGHSPFDYYKGLHLLHKESEDCQNMNIWAPKTLNGAKKPVFVWMHGGGFFSGNALEEYSFDGFNMSHYGDIVFVSINHRLNMIGHFNMEDYGPQYENSINAGVFDLVAALKWIHENIAAFGGDPENVTIAGHSGGGAKVLSMYQIEEATHYFARGICMSGVVPKQEADPVVSKQLAKTTMDILGITKENIEKLDSFSYEEIVDACKKAGEMLQIPRLPFCFGPMPNEHYAGLPYESGWASFGEKKPVLFGSVLGEFARVPLTPEQKEAMTADDKIAFLKDYYGEHAEELMQLFREAYPSHDIIDLPYTDLMFRVPTHGAALTKTKLSPDNTYVYMCSYNCPEDAWVPMWHGGDVCYAFMNEDRVFVLNEAIYGQKLANIFSSMFLNFIKTGDPNTNYLPKWEPYTEEKHNIMVIDRECELRDGHDDKLIAKLLEVVPNPLSFG